MARLRHIAMQVPDLEQAASFYEQTFDMQRVGSAQSPIGDAIMLSDGVVNLTLLNFPEGTTGAINGPDWAGLHHFGFVVEDAAETVRRIERNGGRFHARIPDIAGVYAETKYADPNGVVFDIAEHDWTQARAPQDEHR
jgi:catechol 2,3-dioxygenase-like lactoylglutathione lyase family enzyme